MYSCVPLQKLLQDIIDWCNDQSQYPDHDGVRISWNDQQLRILANYFSQVEVDARFRSRMYQNLRLNAAWQDRFDPRMHKRATQLVVSFLHDLGESFKVPKSQQLSHQMIDSPLSLQRSEIVAGFIKFLLQLLHHAYLFALFPFPAVENCVVKELRFLVTILGDVEDNEQVESSLLDEFERVANEAGALVHSLFFVPDVVVTTTNRALDAFLEHVEILKAKVNKEAFGSHVA